MKTTQQGIRQHYEVLIIGSGIAGLTYALNLSELAPNTKIALVTKMELSASNSWYAQGGLAAAPDESIALSSHIQDTLASGDGLCNSMAVNTIINAGPEAIAALIKYGVKFDQNAHNLPDLVKEGGHTERRIYHYGDTTGAEIIRALTHAVKQLPNITILEFHTAVNLITSPQLAIPHFKPDVLGAYVLENKTGLIHNLLSKVVILATGGAGKVYRYTSNPDTATGDGIAMAYRAGAHVSNMEFYQFHPTLLYHPTQRNFLISEALRGEGAYLRSPRNNERFMEHYAPEKMELATRDVVARAIFNEIENDEFNFVYLDIRHKSREFLQQHFPNIYQTLMKLGIDMHTEMIPVVPGAHYLSGGVLADVEGHTDLSRLYAIGETACTGFHGANRLASNSLLEGVVMGKLAAQASLKDLEKPLPNYSAVKLWDSPSTVNTRRASQINAHWRGLRGEMTSYAGIVRTHAGLKDLLQLVRLRKAIVEEYYWQHVVTQDLIELRNIILVAELIVESALNRKESRGGHYREDYPQHAVEPRESMLLAGKS